MIADSVIALAMHAQASPASFKLSGQPTAACPHDHSKKEDESAHNEGAATKTEEEETPVMETEDIAENPPSEHDAEKKEAESDLEKAARELGEADQDALNLLIVFRLLKDQYGDVDLDFETNKIHVRTPSGIDAVVDHALQEIECKDAAFKLKLQTTVRRIEGALKPIATS